MLNLLAAELAAKSGNSAALQLRVASDSSEAQLAAKRGNSTALGLRRAASDSSVTLPLELSRLLSESKSAKSSGETATSLTLPVSTLDGLSRGSTDISRSFAPTIERSRPSAVELSRLTSGSSELRESL
jgi:hypothetical protein